MAYVRQVLRYIWQCLKHITELDISSMAYDRLVLRYI